MAQKKFVLYSDCLPVKGAQRSIICDLSNDKFHFIPNGLYYILENYNGETIGEIKNKFDNKQNEIIDEYFDFLLSENLIFFTSNPEFFPRINKKWHSPAIITNAIIDFEKIQHNFREIICQLEGLKCSHIQLRFFKEFSIEYVSNLLQIINEEQSRILSVDILLPYYETYIKKDLDILIRKNPRIHAFVLYNAPIENKYDGVINSMGYLILTKRNMLNEKSCGIIHEGYFYSNIKLFTESLNHNTCLNRKISIDRFGMIKNCPSFSENYGNIKNTTLKQAINKEGFKEYWDINKDKIEVCKDCEFRHICTDCRAFIENPNNNYSKPLKCGYDPYTNSWETWSENPIKKDAIEFYELKEILPVNG